MPDMVFKMLKNELIRIGTLLVLLVAIFVSLPAATHAFMDLHTTSNIVDTMAASEESDHKSEHACNCCQEVCTMVFFFEHEPSTSNILKDYHVQLIHPALRSHDDHDFLRPPNT
ncbi:hypothetical protein [Falsihalocynthiibacter sp. CO-5D18]|uniref:hypothetical protein n=1 Tax=Falsihalocynthiibacter sp. CO-5D18 TaxID=3240872 RepID=UPI00350F676B